VDKGLLKILSKMGISLLTSYHGAQIFEALGLADEVMLTAFKGTPCMVAGLGFDDIAAEGAEFSRITFGDEVFGGMAAKVEATSADDEQQKKKLFNYGFLNYFKSGEYHHNNQVRVYTVRWHYTLYEM
jgi:glutamate synthase (ferredoxin)